MRDLWIHPRAQRLETNMSRAFVILDDDSLLTINGPSVCVSQDDGRTWRTWPLFRDRTVKPSWEFGLLRTAEGVIILAYMELGTRKWAYPCLKRISHRPRCRLAVLVLRPLPLPESSRYPAQTRYKPDSHG